MWKNRINGILGLFIVLLPFLGFSFEMHRVLMILVGLIIAVFSFWSSIGARPKTSPSPEPLTFN